LGEGNLEPAIQLLSGQPPEIQQNPRVVQLRAKLDSAKDQLRIRTEQERAKQQQELARQEQEREKERIRQEKEREQERVRQEKEQEKERARQEQERVTVEAIRLAAEALQKQDLRNGINALQAVRKTYGDSPRVSSAIADYVSQRGQIANRLLTAAIESATQSIQKEERKVAIEALGSVSSVAEFADSGLQSNLKRLAKEASKAPPKKPAKPVTDATNVAAASSQAAAQTATTGSGFPKGILFGGLAVVVLAGGGTAYWFLRPAPAAPVGALQISATPYGEVVSITSDKGKAVPLPAGDHWTPMRVEGMAAGSYTVVVKGADGNTQTQSCGAAQTPQVCNIPLQPIDDKTLDEIVGGSK